MRRFPWTANGWRSSRRGRATTWGVLDRGVFYLARPDDGDPQLALLSPHSTQARLLTRLPEFAWNGIAVSRDGARVLYARYDRRDANIGGVMPAR